MERLRKREHWTNSAIGITHAHKHTQTHTHTHRHTHTHTHIHTNTHTHTHTQTHTRTNVNETYTNTPPPLQPPHTNIYTYMNALGGMCTGAVLALPTKDWKVYLCMCVCVRVSVSESVKVYLYVCVKACDVYMIACARASFSLCKIVFVFM
jgi:hypothetical protein